MWKRIEEVRALLPGILDQVCRMKKSAVCSSRRCEIVQALAAYEGTGPALRTVRSTPAALHQVCAPQRTPRASGRVDQYKLQQWPAPPPSHRRASASSPSPSASTSATSAAPPSSRSGKQNEQKGEKSKRGDARRTARRRATTRRPTRRAGPRPSRTPKGRRPSDDVRQDASRTATGRPRPCRREATFRRRPWRRPFLHPYRPVRRRLRRRGSARPPLKRPTTSRRRPLR